MVAPKYPKGDLRRMLAVLGAIDTGHCTLVHIVAATGLDKKTVTELITQAYEQAHVAIRKTEATYSIDAWGPVLKKEGAIRALTGALNAPTIHRTIGHTGHRKEFHMAFSVSYTDRNRFVSNEIWQCLNESPNAFAVTTEINTFKDVLARDGSVKILMPDGSGIKRSVDRGSELRDLIAEVNEARQKAGLVPVQI